MSDHSIDLKNHDHEHEHEHKNDHDSSFYPHPPHPHPPHPPHPHPPHHGHCPGTCGRQDYVLSEGAKVNVQEGKEVQQDIVLSPNPFKDCGTISGVVKDKFGKPIENALVKIFDLNHHPVAHVFTNEEGQFLLCIAPGQYIIKAVR